MANEGIIYHGPATSLHPSSLPEVKKPITLDSNTHRVPDINPADKAVERLKAHAQHINAYKDLPPVDHNTDLRDRVARLENLLQLTLDSLNGATIMCSGGSVVLTFPDLPT